MLKNKINSSFIFFVILLSVPSLAKAEIKRIVVGSGDNLSSILQRANVEKPHSIAIHIDRVTKKSLRSKIKKGREITVRTGKNRNLVSLTFEKNYATDISLNLIDGKWVVLNKPRELFRKISIYSGEITQKNNSVYLVIKSNQAQKIGNEIIDEIAEILGWQIDFTTDVRVGDRFRFFYEESIYNGKRVKQGPVLAIEYISNYLNKSRQKTLKAIFFEIDGIKKYFSLNGKSVQKDFLRYPLKFSRISSRFRVRFHPLLKRRRAHRGVDFAATRGTPVFSVGDGRVIQRVRNRSYGNVITIEHNNQIRTRYAHLQNFKRGLRRGSFVRKGQVIGYVGSTGLSTGPHLHYEWMKYGRQLNPFQVKIPSSRPISQKILHEFRCHSQYWSEIFDSPAVEYLIILRPQLSRCV